MSIDDVMQQMVKWSQTPHKFGPVYVPELAYRDACDRIKELGKLDKSALCGVIPEIIQHKWDIGSQVAKTGLFISALINTVLPATENLRIDLSAYNKRFGAFPLNFFLYRLTGPRKVEVFGTVGRYFLDHTQDVNVKLTTEKRTGRAGDYACRHATRLVARIDEVGDWCGVHGHSGRIKVTRAGHYFSAFNHGMTNTAKETGRRVAYLQDGGRTIVTKSTGREAAYGQKGGETHLPSADHTTAKLLEDGDVYVHRTREPAIAPGIRGGRIHFVQEGVVLTLTPDRNDAQQATVSAYSQAPTEKDVKV